MFTGDQPSLTEKQILDIVYKDLPHYYYKDSEGVVIGDIFIHINDYATTKLPLDLQILNLTWSDELLNPNSFLFQQYSVDLCRDVRNICFSSIHQWKIFEISKKLLTEILQCFFLSNFTTYFYLNCKEKIIFEFLMTGLFLQLERIAKTSGIDLPKIVGCEVKQYG